MKGKSVFSNAEEDRVRDLLRKVRKANRDRQKTLRDQLRREVAFCISDFTKSNTGFKEADFDILVERGTIRIG